MLVPYGSFPFSYKYAFAGRDSIVMETREPRVACFATSGAGLLSWHVPQCISTLRQSIRHSSREAACQ